MKLKINIFIFLGWLLCNVALFVPWMATLFGGDWLSGWFWIVLNLHPFFFLVTFQEAKFEYIGSYLFSMSVIIMFVSPLLLYIVNRTYNRMYARIIVVGSLLAFASLFTVLLVPMQSPLPGSYIGYFLYVCAYALLALGFVKLATSVLS